MTYYWKWIKNRIQEEGVLVTVSDGFYFLRRLVWRNVLDKFVLWNKKDSLLSDGKLVDLPSHTIERNRREWNTYDWSEYGEEWVPEVQLKKGLDPTTWKNKLTNEVMMKYIKKGSSVLEIGPGGGRWTEILQPLAKTLIIGDISNKCIEICKKRFELKNNIEYKLIEKRLNFINDSQIDFIWSYGVFVHINPSDIDRYIEDFSRILKPGGCGVIHHCGIPSDYNDNKGGWSVFVGAELFAQLVKKHGMKIVEQNKTLVRQGDVISIFVKPHE